MAIYPPEAAPPPFELCGGHPALDFVNSLNNRFDPAGSKELLTDYDALLRFAGETGLLNLAHARGLAREVSPAAATRALRSARELREAISAVLYAEVDQLAPAT